MLHIIKDDFDESPEDILNTINNMLNKKEENENKEEKRKKIKDKIFYKITKITIWFIGKTKKT